MSGEQEGTARVRGSAPSESEGALEAFFRGAFRWDLLHPFPAQDGPDREVGDALLARLGAVLEAHVDPVTVDGEAAIPPEALRALAGAGAFGMLIPTAYGGLGLSRTNFARALSCLGSHCLSTAMTVAAHQGGGVPEALLRFGTEAQRARWLPRLARGGLSAIALTEPGAGSDPAQMETWATPAEDGTRYVLRGRKLWVTNGPGGDVALVMARTPPVVERGREVPRVTAFLVDLDAPGVVVEHRCAFVGLRGVSNGVLRFDGVEVPAENVVGAPGQGLKIALTTLNTGRLGLSAALTGACRKLLLECERWTSERVQGGVPIGMHQAVARRTANLAASVYAMESVVRVCCARADRGDADIRLEAAAAKYFCTETAWRVMDDFVQIRGGRGCETEASLYARGSRPVPAERFLRDCRAGRIFEGSSEVMQIILARAAVDMHLRLLAPIVTPGPGEQGGLVYHLWRAARFYGAWYPRTWLPSFTDFNVSRLEEANRRHLTFAARASRRLGRSIFHALARYRSKLDQEQVLLASHVDIGVDLLAMSAVLANTERRAGERPADRTPQDLADLFCKEARLRIGRNFAAVRDNHNALMGKMSRALMGGKYRWLAEDIHEDLPPGCRDYDQRSSAQ